MIAAADLRFTLSHFTGTSRYIHDPFTGLLYTEGIMHMADRAEAHWLLSDIGIVFRHDPKIRDQSFQLWTLTVNDDTTAILTCQEDCDTPILYSQKYEYTDFPIGTWKMYLCNGVLMIPSEY